MILSAANANDSTMLEAVLDDIPAIRMPTGRRQRRPAKVHGDNAYAAVGLPAPVRHPPQDRPAQDRVLNPAWPSPLDN